MNSKRTILVVDDNKLMLKDTCSEQTHSFAITLKGREVSKLLELVWKVVQLHCKETDSIDLMNSD
jgi:hypothetical protein